MLTLEFHLQAIGASLIGLALLHLAFPRRFDWATELTRLSLLNRQIFVVHCLFICLVLVLMGALALFFTGELLAPSRLARVVAAGLTIFWAARLFAQWFIYDRALWRGHLANTIAHICFTFLWSYYTGIFGWLLWRQSVG